MQYRKEYKEVMRQLELRDWGNVKRRLCDKDASVVIRSLLAYTDAFLLTKKLESLYAFEPTDQMLHMQIWEQRAIRNALDRELRILLVGVDEVEHYERWLRYEIPDLD
jgi:hypothetical protein